VADSATYTFQRVADLKAIMTTPGVDIIVAGDGYASWDDAVRKRERFTACVRRGAVTDGTPLPADGMRFVLLLQRGWRRNIAIARLCGMQIVAGEVADVIDAYLSAAATDPRKLIAQSFSRETAGPRTGLPLVPVHILFGLEAGGQVLLPLLKGPYMVSA
jgi:hypothetical protein